MNVYQFVQRDGFLSTEEEIDTGVPQGSVLGPLLFLVHISDLRYATNLETLNFADDTLLYHTFENPDEIQNYMNKEMVKVHKWMENNHLRINSSKTKFMIFHKQLKKFKDLHTLRLKIGTHEELEQVKDFKYLGLTIDQHLNWKQHIAILARKLSKSLYKWNSV